MKGWRRLLSAAALAAVTLVARPAHAGFLEDAGWGTATVLTNVVYMPVKVIYATFGGVTGGFAYVLTGLDMQTAESIWVPSMAGTYVVTPAMLRGEEAIAFAGTPAADASTTDAYGVSDSRAIDEQQLGGS
jgi:hypothetical protein